jgi:hypothetical protein
MTMIINNFNKILLLIVNAVIISAGCGQMIKTDMDTYLHNREAYRQKKIVFQADLTDLLERYELYKGKYVEVTAPVTYNGREGFPTWYIMLEKDGNTIRAYEEHYRYYVTHEALELLAGANNEGDEVTVRGKLKKEGIEIKELVFQERVVDTDFIPAAYRQYWSGGSKPQREYHNSWFQWHFSPGFSYR